MMTLPRLRSALLIGFCAPISVTPLLAQRSLPAPASPPDAPSAPTPPRRSQIYINGQALKPGGRLGVTLRTGSGPADTLGVLISDVEEGAPADKAGIRDGARLVSIDGIDLRLDPRDLGDSAAEMMPENRLRRRLGEKSEGETVTLEVQQNGRTETKRVTLAAAPVARIFGASAPTARRVLGVGFSQRGSMRDTAGLLITSLSDDGAAEKAGLLEGDRIVSIDGVDLRVPVADAGTPDAVEARIARLRRALDAARDSQPVRLEVLSEGRRRTVSVTPTTETSWGWSMSPAQVQGMAADIRAGLSRNFALSDEERREIERARREAVREGQRARVEAERSMREAQREMQNAQREMQRGQRERARAQVEIERMERDGRRIDMDEDDDDRDAPRGTVSIERRRDGRRMDGTIRGRTDGATLSLDGLALASIDRDFAQQLGRDAERGALVIRASDDWAPLRAGDVILSIENRSVRDGNALDVTIDRDRDQRIEILRGGRMQVLVLRPAR